MARPHNGGKITYDERPQQNSLARQYALGIGVSAENDSGRRLLISIVERSGSAMTTSAPIVDCRTDAAAGGHSPASRGSALRVRKRKRHLTKDDYRMICETIELVLWRAEERYKQERRKQREEAKSTSARRRSAS